MGKRGVRFSNNIPSRGANATAPDVFLRTFFSGNRNPAAGVSQDTALPGTIRMTADKQLQTSRYPVATTVFRSIVQGTLKTKNFWGYLACMRARGRFSSCKPACNNETPPTRKEINPIIQGTLKTKNFWGCLAGMRARSGFRVFAKGVRSGGCLGRWSR